MRALQAFIKDSYLNEVLFERYLAYDRAVAVSVSAFDQVHLWLLFCKQPHIADHAS
jgi:hypothetical protein